MNGRAGQISAVAIVITQGQIRAEPAFPHNHETDLVPDARPQRRCRSPPDRRRRSDLGDQPAVTVEHVDERTGHEVRTVHQGVGAHLKAQREPTRAVIEVCVTGRFAPGHLDVLVTAVELQAVANHRRRRRRTVDDIDDVCVMDEYVTADMIHVKDYSTNVYDNVIETNMQPKKLITP